MGVSWIKITTTMFDDEKIRIIESMPDADTILIIWVKLLTLCGKCNANGYIMLSESILYTDEMLATIFNRPLSTIRLALEVFRNFGMVEDTDNGLLVCNWEKHQNIAGLDRIREQTRKRVAKHREKQMRLDCNVTSSVTVTPDNATDIEEDIEEEKNNKRLSSKVFDDDSPALALSNKLQSLILSNNPKAKPGNLQNWASEFDRMIRLDKRTYDEIVQVMEFSQSDGFWMSNILSAKKLRDKFDTLYLQSQTKKPKAYTHEHNISDLEKTIARKTMRYTEEDDG